jgi:hypothetical protein
VTPSAWALGILGLVVPAIVWAAGGHDWALGLWVGGALGWGSFLWIRATVHRAFRADAGPPALKTVLWHSSLRLGITAAVLIAVIRFRAGAVWGVVLGYTLMQIPAVLRETQGRSCRHRGV